MLRSLLQTENSNSKAVCPGFVWIFCATPVSFKLRWPTVQKNVSRVFLLLKDLPVICSGAAFLVGHTFTFACHNIQHNASLKPVNELALKQNSTKITAMGFVPFLLSNTLSNQSKRTEFDMPELTHLKHGAEIPVVNCS